MTAEKEYMIYLLSCFLSGSEPEGREVDWEELYRIADNNDIGALIGNVAKKTGENYNPPAEIKSKFNQLLGYAVRTYEIKNAAINKLKAILNENGFDFILVKGAVVKELYPVKELRTSSDVDIILKISDFELAEKLFSSAEFAEKYGAYSYFTKPDTLYFKIDNTLMEFHFGADVKNDYFDNIFDVATDSGNNEYTLDNTYQLMYVFLHFVKHMVDRGAGIRMLADMDVLIRNGAEFDENRFLEETEKAGERRYAELILTLLSKAFNTPVKTACEDVTPEFYDEFFNAVIDGGSFGYIVQSKGFYHYYNANDGKVSNLKKIKAMVRYIFPPAQYVRTYREYSQKHAVLIPFAYIGRMKDAFTKRRKLALSTFKQIADIDDNDISQRKFFEKTDYENKHRKE